MSNRRDDEFTDYMTAGLASLQRVAYLLCQDRQRAEDLVQAALTRLYVHWAKARAADHIDAYVRGILVREFLKERRSAWTRRVTLSPEPSAGRGAGLTEDREAAVDMRAALARLPRRQRATLVLRFYCDLTVDQAAAVLPGAGLHAGREHAVRRDRLHLRCGRAHHGRHEPGTHADHV